MTIKKDQVREKLIDMRALCGLNIIKPWLNIPSTGELDAGTLAVKFF